MRKHESDTNRARISTNWLACRRRAGRSPLRHSPYSCPERLVVSEVELSRRAILHSPSRRRRAGFTLLELVVVVAILAILMVATFFVIDPLQMVARANDTRRLTDLDVLNDAILSSISNGPSTESGGTDLDGSNTNTCVGESAQTVYVSVDDGDGAGGCNSAPANLPAGWTYACANPGSVANVNGTGWLPVDFASGASGSPISNLPIDPENTFSSGYYFSYVCTRNRKFELNARMVSQKNRTGGNDDQQSGDGGDDIFAYEVGTNLELDPKAPVAYWPLDGGTSGAILENETMGFEDTSGNGNNGRADNNDASGMSWVNGIKGGAVDFDGTDDHIDMGNPSSLQLIDNETISLWLKPSDFSTRKNPFAKAYGGENTLTQEMNGSLNYYYGTAGANAAPYQGYSSDVGDLSSGAWTNMVIVRDLVSMRLYWYENGAYQKDGPATYAQAVASSLNAYIGRGYVSNFAGTIDEVALYDRALTAEEIAYQYEALKP